MFNEDLKLLSFNFVNEFKKASLGNASSLLFIKNSLPGKKLVKNGEKFQVIVIGGTIFRSAIVLKNEKGIKILSLKEGKIPVFKTKEIFLDFMLSHLEKGIKFLALNFAFPIKPIFIKNKLDGVLLRATKEHGFKGAIGKKIGKIIEDYIFLKTKHKVLISLANDTICLLLSGLVKNNWENLGAVIVGTGFNMAVFLDENTAVNLEAGNFNKFTPSKEGKAIDAKSDKPGVNIFEKEMAGGYLYQHFNLWLDKEKIEFKKIKSTKELNSLAVKNIPQISAKAKELFEYSAYLLASQIAGVMKFKNKDMVFVMTGSLFHKGLNYSDKVKEALSRLAPNYKVSFLYLNNSDILGASMLVA